MTKTTKKKFNFAQSFDRLEKIVDDLESGETDLDQALKEYEEGLKIVQECKSKLKEVGIK